MSGPREPWRSRALTKAAVERIGQRWFNRLAVETRGGRWTRPGDNRPIEHLAPVEPRETRERDRSLNGKARRRARRAA